VKTLFYFDINNTVQAEVLSR